MRKTVFLILLFFPVLAVYPQNWPGSFFKGYARSLKGGGFEYHSPRPGVNSSLLVRSIDSAQYIEWETEKIPPRIPGGKVNFVWIFGIDANTDSHTFRLYVNGRYCLSFSNPVVSDLKPWKADGPGGATLTFRTTMIDKYGDPMGYAVLSLPGSMVPGDRPQVMRIVGESKESRSWYMTFESGVGESVDIVQVPALMRGQNGNQIPVLFRFEHLGDPVTGTIRTSGCPEKQFTLETGFNEVRLLLPEKTPAGEHTATVTVEGKETERHFTISPSRHFTIFLVQHTHTDIGYTRPQTEILPDHLRYIDYALDFCDLTDTLPDDARFRWTCETSWAVREYLRTRPASQVERLRKRVSEGRIEITGLFLNSSDLADEATIAATLQPIGEFRKMGFPVKAAMQDDINGVPWCLADYLSGAGVEFLNMGQNDARALKPFDRPTTFWWESPSGNRILVNRPEHYMWGNSLGILSNEDTFGKSLFRHLDDITAKGYPYDAYAIQFSGYLTDNSPPSTKACSLVEQWNKDYVWPRLRLATISEFPEIMKKNHGGELPVVRGAWPDWWMDGFGSAAIQTAYARQAHADCIANEGLMAMSAMMGIPADPSVGGLLEQITDDLAFYDEHTFGAAESITDPMCENSVVQLGEKEAFVWSAVKKNRILREEVMGQIQPLLPKAAVPSLVIFNTLNWSRSGNALVYMDHQILPGDRKFRITDPYKHVIPAQQVASREEGSWWMLDVRDVPPLGFFSCHIEVLPETVTPLQEMPFTGIMENGFYRVEVDRNTGKITRIYDKEWKKELADPHAPWSAGEVIYERLGKNRGQLEQRRLEEYTRTAWRDVSAGNYSQGEIWQSVTLTGRLPGCAADPGIRCEIRLYNHEKKLEFFYTMKKLPVTDPEGVYVSFPFRLDGGRHVVEVAGGTMVAGREQIPGSATDWTGIQNFVALRNDSGQVIFSSPAIPLVQLGDINLGRFDSLSSSSRREEGRSYPATGYIYSWVMNNYWTTNFLASQEGELKWSYQVTSVPDPSNTAASRFGMENRIPLLSRVFPAAVRPDTVSGPQSFYSTPGGKHVVLVSARRSTDGKDIVLQLRETAGTADSLTVSDVLSSCITLDQATRARSVYESNVLEERVKLIWPPKTVPSQYNPDRIRFKPYEAKFVLVTR